MDLIQSRGQEEVEASVDEIATQEISFNVSRSRLGGSCVLPKTNSELKGNGQNFSINLYLVNEVIKQQNNEINELLQNEESSRKYVVPRRWWFMNQYSTMFYTVPIAYMFY